tara:strand:- start:1321 stop:2082 length:762 start_codon:yes stop_codon:yes gene_type:complete
VQEKVYTIKVVGNTKGFRAPPRSSARFPKYLKDTFEDAVESTLSVTFNFEPGFAVGYIEVDENVAPFSGFGEGEQKYSFKRDKTYEFEFINPGFVHPYHQHINSFQVTESEVAIPAEVSRIGEWRDVIPNFGGFHTRTRMDDFSGQMVCHCHILQHEDHGMMGWYLIEEPEESDKNLSAGKGEDGWSTRDVIMLGAISGVGIAVLAVGSTVYIVRRMGRKADEEHEQLLSNYGEMEYDTVTIRVDSSNGECDL